MALNINAEHRLVTVDDSGITSVSVCLCGRSWVAIGEERIQDARYEHAKHVFNAGSAMVGGIGNGRVRQMPVRSDFPNFVTPPPGRPEGGGVSAEERRREIEQLQAAGLSLSEAAMTLGLTVTYVRKVLSANSQKE